MRLLQRTWFGVLPIDVGLDRYYGADALGSHGTLIAVSPDPNWPPSAPVGGSVSFVTIGEQRDIAGPVIDSNEHDTTAQNDDEESFIVGMRRKGTMTFGINYVPSLSTHDHNTGLMKDRITGNRKIFRKTYPDGTVVMFSGFVKTISDAEPVDGVLTADVTIRPTGPMSFVDAP